MKNLISAAIIATVASFGAAASADITKMGVVIKDGVAVGSIYNSKILDGFTDAEARAFVMDFYADKELQAKKDKAQDKRKARKARIAELNVELKTADTPETRTSAEINAEIDAVELQNERATRYPG